MAENFPLVVSKYSLIEIPSYDVSVLKYGSRVEQRVLLDPDPSRVFEMRFESLRLSDALLILDFFHARRGNYESFSLQNREEAYRDAAWKAATTYYAGDIVRPVAPSGRSYRCTTAGTSHAATEPTWPTAYHGTVSDNSVIWTENSYLVRFEEPAVNFENVRYNLYAFGAIRFVEVPA